jgi:hypothetical protein
LLRETDEDTPMDNSIYQARWLLASVFSVAFVVLCLGAFAS